MENLISNRKNEWEDDTASDVRVLVGIFRGILEEHGVVHSGEITQEHVAALRQHFNHILPLYGRSPRLRALSPAALRAESKRRADEAAASGEKIELGLSRATIRRHLGNLDHFLKHLRASHFTVPEWTFEGLRPKKPPKGEIRLQQVKPKPEDIRPLFDIPFFTGRRSVEEPEVAGDHVFHSASYYLPMLFTYLGSRRKEFAGLMVDEIVQSEGHWSIQIKASEVRRIKNAQSHRLLPVPNELLRLNFIEYVERLKELGHKMLFPELFSPYLTNNDPGDRFYKDFVPVAKKCMPGGLWQRPVHALRHGFANTLKQAGVSDGVIEDISGRLGETETATRYTNPAGLSLIQLIISRYPVITGHLEPQPIRLLPWVERMEPPPWAGKKRGDRFGNKRGRATPPSASSVAILLMLGEAVAHSGHDLADLLAILRRPKPIVAVIASARGFETSFVDLFRLGFVLPGKASLMSGYELRSVRDVRVPDGSRRVLVHFAERDLPDDRTGIVDRQVSLAIRNSYGRNALRLWRGA